MNNETANCLRRTTRAGLAAAYIYQAVDQRVKELTERIRVDYRDRDCSYIDNLLDQLRWVGHAAFEEWRGGESKMKQVVWRTSSTRIRDVAEKLLGYLTVYKNDGNCWNGNAPSGYKLANYGEELLAALGDPPPRRQTIDTTAEPALGQAVQLSQEAGGRDPKMAEEPPQPTSGDMVNLPPHYTFGTIEVITVILDWGLGYLAGNVVKYVARAKYKGAELQDLEKARWFLNKLIEVVKGKVV